MIDLEDVVRAIETAGEHTENLLSVLDTHTGILENIEGMLQVIVDHIEADGPGTINEIPNGELIDPYAA